MKHNCGVVTDLTFDESPGLPLTHHDLVPPRLSLPLVTLVACQQLLVIPAFKAHYQILHR